MGAAARPAGAPGRLSARQREALELIARGATDQQAGRLMHISAQTVRHHTARARDRLGAITTAHAVAIAVQRGLIQL